MLYVLKSSAGLFLIYSVINSNEEKTVMQTGFSANEQDA